MKRITRIIISVLLIVAIIVPVAIFANAEVNVSTTPAKQTETVEYYNLREGLYTKKTIAGPDANGNYDVTIDAYTSDVRFIRNEVAQNALDIYVLMDNSASMGSIINETSSAYRAREAVANMIELLATKYGAGSKIEINIAFYTFANDSFERFGYTSINNSNYNSLGNKVKHTPGNPGAGGTETDVGFKIASENIQKRKSEFPNNKQILLFISDGGPAKGGDTFDKWDKDENKYVSAVGTPIANRTLEIAENLKKIADIYSLGIGGGYSTAKIANKNDVLSTVVTDGYATATGTRTIKHLKETITRTVEDGMGITPRRCTVFLNIVSSAWKAINVKSYEWADADNPQVYADENSSYHKDYKGSKSSGEYKNWALDENSSWQNIPSFYTRNIDKENPKAEYYFSGDVSELTDALSKSVTYSLSTHYASQGSLLGDFSIKDTLSDYFEILPNSWATYKVPYDSKSGAYQANTDKAQYGEGDRAWGTPVSMTLDVNTTTGNDGTINSISIPANEENASVKDSFIVKDDTALLNAEHSGNKLRLTFKIRPKNSYIGGITPTNVYNSSGVFDKDGKVIQNFASIDREQKLNLSSPLLQVALVNATAKIDSDNVKIGYIYNLDSLGRKMPTLTYNGRYTDNVYSLKNIDDEYAVYDSSNNKVVYSPASTTTDDNGKTVAVAETKPNDFVDVSIGDAHLANNAAKSGIVSNSDYVQFNKTGISYADNTYSKNNPNVNRYIYLSWTGMSTQDKYIKERFPDYNNTGKDSKATETDGIVDGIRYYLGREAMRQLEANVDVIVYVPAIIVNDAVLNTTKTYPVDSKALTDAFDDFNSQSIKDNTVDTDTLNTSMTQGVLSSLVSARIDTSSANEFVLLKPNGASLTVDRSNDSFIDDAFDISEQSNITAYIKAFADMNGNIKSAGSTVANKDQLKFTLSYNELDDKIKTLSDAPFKLTVDEFWATNECTECDATDKYIPQFMGYQAQVHIVSAENSITVNKTGCDTNHSNASFVFTVLGFKSKSDGTADLSTMKVLNNFTIQGNGKRTIKVDTAQYPYYCVVEDLNALSRDSGWTWDYSDVSIDGSSWIQDNSIESHIFTVGENGTNLTFNNIYDDSNSNLHYASAYAVNIMSNDKIETTTSPANVID